MTLTFAIKDYKSTYFEYQTLDQKNDQSALETLLYKKMTIESNLQSEPTVHGSTQLHNLALGRSEQVYTTIPDAGPLIQPLKLGPFKLSMSTGETKRSWSNTIIVDDKVQNPNVTDTMADITQQKATYDETWQVYFESYGTSFTKSN